MGHLNVVSTAATPTASAPSAFEPYNGAGSASVQSSAMPSSAMLSSAQPSSAQPLNLDAAAEDTTSIYGSHYALQDLPRFQMPDREMPRDVAYHMISDELSLDGNPKMNLASFVTTYMEPEAEKLMMEALPKNFIDYEEYPQTAGLQSRCVNMIGHLFHAPANHDAVGTSTIGSSEAIILAVLAMKRRWQNAQGPHPDPRRRPNLVMSAAVQVCWEKAVRYLDVDPRLVYVEPGRCVLDPAAAVALVDADTIGMCAILGTTYTGEYEDVRALNDLLVARGLDTPIHVDAASGGFVAPFVVPDLVWDFALPRVVSINTSGHKYGLVYPGVGWVLWRSADFLPPDLVFHVNYLGADQATFTLNFSKSASQVIAQYYQLVRLGRSGYRAIMLNLTRTADYLAAALAELGFVILSKLAGAGLPLVAFRFATAAETPALPHRGAHSNSHAHTPPDSKSGPAPVPASASASTATADLPTNPPTDPVAAPTAAATSSSSTTSTTPSSHPPHTLLRPALYDEFALARQLRTRGWIVPAYTMAPHEETMKLLRVVVRNDLTRARCDMLLADIRLSLAQLDAADAAELSRAHASAAASAHGPAHGHVHGSRARSHHPQYHQHVKPGNHGVC